ncbi:MAG: hypothetical protein SFV54_04740 [Bryobacteraceae bacterium]|nr:hypothetical protein [Bryobacteraceae bacterium]
MVWAPTIAAFVAALAAAWLTPFSSAPWTVVFVLVVGSASAAGARLAMVAFLPELEEEHGRGTWLHAALGLWVAPLVVLAAHQHWLAIVGAPFVAIAAARLVDQYRRRLEDLDDEDGGFVLPAAMAVVLAQAAVVAWTMRRTGVAAVLAGSACLIVAARRFRLMAGAPSVSRRPRTRAALTAVLATVICLGGLVRVPRAAQSEPGENAGRGRGGARFDDKSLLTGAILTPRPKGTFKLVAPVKTPHNTPSTRARPPASVPFTGEYWIFPQGRLRPPKSALVERDTPLSFVFTAVDQTRLLMQARQRLGAPIRLRCCSAIEVALRNEDSRPDLVKVGVSLASSEPGRAGRQQLALLPLPGTKDVLLHFPMPRQTAIDEFDEIVVEFDLYGARRHRSAKLEIESFTLVPR